MIRRILAILFVAVVGSTALAMPPAGAASGAFRDRAGDVPHAMDIRRVAVANGPRLIVTVRHRAVFESGGAWSGLYIDATPNRVASPDYYLAGSVGGDYQLFWMDGWKVGGKLGCPGGDYQYAFSTSTDTTRFSLARSCLNGATTRATKLRVAVIAGMSGRKTDWAPRWHKYSRWFALN